LQGIVFHLKKIFRFSECDTAAELTETELFQNFGSKSPKNRPKWRKMGFFVKKSRKIAIFQEKNLINDDLRGILCNLQYWGRDFCTLIEEQKTWKHGALQARLHQKDAVMEPGDSVS
jgi:hypothetical protein